MLKIGFEPFSKSVLRFAQPSASACSLILIALTSVIAVTRETGGSVRAIRLVCHEITSLF